MTNQIDIQCSKQHDARQQHNNVDQLKVWPNTYETSLQLTACTDTLSKACHRLSKGFSTTMQLAACTDSTANLPQAPVGFLSIYGLNRHNSEPATGP
jgi:hypothetical protein